MKRNSTVEIPFHTKALAIIGIAAITLQLNAVPFEAFLFHLNQKHIASTLCEHKVPNCNGHCFLMKQMAKTNASSDKKAVHSSGSLDGHYLPVALKNLMLFPTKVNLFAGFVSRTSTGWDLSSPHPPRIA